MVALTVVIRDKCYYKDFDSELEVKEDTTNCTLGWVGVDEVVPTIELTIEGTIGSNNWYTSDTWVHMQVKDNSGTGVDTHMARYLEWTTASYLTNSLYGRCTSQQHVVMYISTMTLIFIQA